MSVSSPLTESERGFFDRTLESLRRAWQVWQPGENQPAVPENWNEERFKAHIDECLAAKGGEVSARARASELGYEYLALDGEGRKEFLRLLAQNYSVDDAKVDAAVEAWQSAGDASAKQQAANQLRQALLAPRVRLLTQFNELRQGMKFLVDMRATLIPLVQDDPALKPLDDDLQALLTSWFDIGFLDLLSISWDAPASLLEKLINYEAVHEIQSWDDLKNRLEPDRRCYAFFHPHMPDEPLIFVEVALVKGVADNVQVLLDEGAPQHDPARADTAIFYSISNAQAGLAGVSFGDFLIKRVVDDVARELPNIKTFATLSPIPGLNRWLKKMITAEYLAETLSSQELDALKAAAAASASGGEDSNPPPTPDSYLRQLIEDGNWYDEPALSTMLQPILHKLAAVYLLKARRGEQAFDRVEHFHLSNGARLERINWRANSSLSGREQSSGMMVNYLYHLKDIEKNHEAYKGQGKIAASAAVRKMIRG